MKVDSVSDHELLYRCVKKAYVVREGNKVRLSSQAFADRLFRPSVDRAAICGNSHYTQQDETDFVVSIEVAKVRGIHTVSQMNAHGDIVHTHAINVEAAPLPHNLAHAEIYGTPNFANQRVFKRLQESLALLASWEIGPTKTVDDTTEKSENI